MHEQRWMRPSHGEGPSGQRLKEEIEILEQRLKEIGPDGDCGYEKAMIRFFREQIDLRLARLSAQTGL